MATIVEVTPRLLYADYDHTLIIQPAENKDPEILFERTCAEFENPKIEQDCEGNIRIIAPVGGESSNQNIELTTQLQIWTRQDGRGKAFDSSVEFVFPDGSKLGPDAAWVSKKRLSALPRLERRKFLKVVPEFVVELKSPTDRYSDLKKKMGDYIRNGVNSGG
jgi:Uma2 family endonuclease